MAVLKPLMAHESLVLQDAETVGPAPAKFSSSLRWGFFDCLVLEIAGKAGHLPLGTFDRAFRKFDGVQTL